jgi:uncharacterized zinc-type alcohol dehydrogenase-like protein
MTKTKAWAAQSATAPLAPFTIDRRDVKDHDVAISILYCGVCHSDLHTVRSEWGGTVYPCIPGHEIVGRVAAVGPQVTRFREGDLVGVGCLVDSCRHCAECAAGYEQFCENGFTGTYNSKEQGTGANTYGGYTERIVADENFVLRVNHDKRNLAAVAPLLCAGITTYSPLRHWNVGAGSQVGIVGLGGLGHMGVKLAHAMGAHVAVFTTSAGKRDDAMRLGANEVVVSRSGEDMKAHRNRFDLIIDTVAAAHDLDPYVAALKRDGSMVLVGAPPTPHPSPAVMNLIFGRRSIAGSLIGGIAETQEMLDFCAAHNVVSDIEMIRIQQIDEAYDRMVRGDVKYRFVIDNASLTTPV